MPLRAALIDCDGVVLDNESLHERAARRTLAGFGVKVNSDWLAKNMRFHSVAEVQAAVERDFGVTIPATFAAKQRRLALSAYATRLHAVHGIKHSLGLLPHLEVGMTTSGDRSRIEWGLRRVGLWRTFKGRIFTTAEVGKEKSDPGIFLLAADYLGSKPEETFVVDDGVPGGLGARRAGMIFIGYDQTGGNSQALAEAGAHYTIGDMHYMAHVAHLATYEYEMPDYYEFRDAYRQGQGVGI